MGKETFYFSHDFNARNDPKMQKVLMRLGQEGKGVYWDLIEMLFEEGGYLLISECDSYAFALRTTTTCIISLINDFGLFKKNDELFWSDSVNRRLLERENKSEKARQSAKNRWNNANASKNTANALGEKCESNTIKERKGKNNNIAKDLIDFDVFWNKYNKKVGNRPKCKTKWDNLDFKTQTFIIHTLDQWKNQFKDIQFQPFPETYLNQQRWNDELLEKDGPMYRKINGQSVTDHSSNKNLFKVG